MSVNLPEIDFCETDTEAVERQIIEKYQQVAGVALYPGDPVRLFLEALAYLIAQQRFMIDFAGKMNLVSLSQGDYLDHLGALLATPRLGSQAARTTLRFTLSGALDWPVVIPAGTRATADGRLYWSTTADVVIEAGRTEGEAEAVCQQAGSQGNGLLPGQINRLVDRHSYLAGVSNTSLTLGGTDLEDDERYRARIQLAPERLCTCGPADAYRWWALSVSQDIADVAVWSPQPGQVRLAPLMRDGGLPAPEIITKVTEAVQDKRRRPLTDVVRVVPPEVVEYQVYGVYHLRASYAAQAAGIQAQVQQVLREYLAWQRARLGRDITPSELVSRVQQVDGVQRVELSAPAYQALDPWQVAAAGQAELAYGGLSDD